MCYINTDLCLVPLPNNLYHVKKTIVECPLQEVEKDVYDELEEDARQINKINGKYYGSYLKFGDRKDDPRRLCNARCVRDSENPKTPLDVDSTTFRHCPRTTWIPMIDYDVYPQLMDVQDPKAMEKLCLDKSTRLVHHFVMTLEQIMEEFPVPDNDNGSKEPTKKYGDKRKEVMDFLPTAQAYRPEMENEIERQREVRQIIEEAERAKAKSSMRKLLGLLEGS